MSATPPRWSLCAPISRRGANHRRFGIPCQDTSAACELRSVDDRPVMVMAVADGHGGEDYPFSDVGSQLACERALAEVSGAILRRPLAGDSFGAWEQWLKLDLPRALHASWLKACERHWQELQAEWQPSGHGPTPASGPESDGALVGLPPELAEFRPHLYGTTLGLVVMTPDWWGHTGVGDWDLVRLWGQGEAELVSSELPAQVDGEVTASLAHERAWDLFSPRAALLPVRARERPFALLMSTDGLRKSCASTADLLGLCGRLAQSALAEGHGEAGDGEELESALDRISAEGCGDDLSLAIAVCGRLSQPGQPLAPVPPAEALPAVDASAAGGRSLQPRLDDDPGLENARSHARRARLESEWDDDEEDEEDEDTGPPWFVPLLLVAAALAVCGPLLWRLMLGVAPPVPPAQALKIQDEVTRLCSGPAVMRRNLQSRRDVFEGLMLGRLNPQQLEADAARDPLAALIASSFDPSSRSMRSSPTIAGYELCQKLRQELENQWRISQTNAAGR
ncbi:MAG: protein phosphatase 2C domain-containing protein [Synechococcaceae cyanobacterium]